MNSKRARHQMNLSRISMMLNLDRGTLRRHIQMEGVKPCGKDAKGGNLYDLKDLKDVLSNVYENIRNFDPGCPRDRLAWYQGERERIKYLQATGALVSADWAHREMAGVAKQVANVFDTLPDLLERDHGLAADKLALVEQTLDRVRMELFEAVCSADEDD